MFKESMRQLYRHKFVRLNVWTIHKRPAGPTQTVAQHRVGDITRKTIMLY